MDDMTAMRIVFDPGRTERVKRRRIEVDLGDGQTARVDVYRRSDDTGDRALPGVLFVPGDAPQAVLDGVLDWGQYQSWGEAVAARSMLAIVAEHPSSDNLRQAPVVAAFVARTLDAVRDLADETGLDPERLAVWTASAGASYGALAALRAKPPVTALVVYYGVLDLRGWAAQVGTLDSVAAASASAAVIAESLGSIPPTLLVTAGADNEALNATNELFASAVTGKCELERLHHPTGRHAFDILDDDQTSAAIIARTLEYLADRLRAR